MLAIVSKNQILLGLLDARCELDGLAPVAEFQSIEEVPANTDIRLLLIHVTDRDPGLWQRVAGSGIVRAGVRVVLFGSDDLINEIASVMPLGVAACVSESRPVDDLLTVLKGVDAGFRVMPLEADEPAVHPAPSRSAAAVADAGMASDPLLSGREVAILGLLRDGLSNKDIAKRLGIVESTVKVHLRSCYSKLRAKNRTQAALWAANNLGSAAHQGRSG